MAKRILSSVDASLHISQLDPQARSMLLRTARSQWLSEIAKKVNNQDPRKREIIRKAQLRRWADWRAAKKAEQHSYNTSNGLPVDTPMPVVPKAKKARVITRKEAIEIGYQEVCRKFPQGMTESNKAEFMAFVPSDPRLKPFL